MMLLKLCSWFLYRENIKKIDSFKVASIYKSRYIEEHEV